ncbi:hypothetical protein P3L10_009183 [Capsicum annuum]
MKAISSTVIVNIYQIKSSFICLQVCVSSVDPTLFPAVVETGALMVEIGNYDSFYVKGLVFTPVIMSN